MEEVADLLPAAPAVHGLEHMVADVLDGNVQIFDDLRLVGDHLNELVADLIGIEIVQPDPMHVLDGTELGQELGQGALPVEVQAVAGDVLGHDDELFHPGVHQVLGLLEDRFLRAAAELAPDEGDDAVSAAVVTALGNAQPSPVVGGADDPVRLRHGGVDVPEKGGALPL